MEILEFVFSSFWIWLGFVVIISVFGNTIVYTVAAIRGGK
jgi:hypothetical protein